MALDRGSLNKVILIGHLGRDPELQYTPSGVAVAKLNLATNRAWKDENGNQVSKTEWHRIVLWRKLAEVAGEWLKKGNLIYIEGRLETRSWTDNNNVKRYMTEVIADSMTMLGGKGETAGATQKPSEPAVPEEPPMEPDTSMPDYTAEPEGDDLPF